MLRRRFTMLAVAVAFLLFGFGIPSAFGTPSEGAYTQSGAGTVFSNAIPMGHEWVTRMAAIELLGYAPPTVPDVPDPSDPRKVWTQGLAKNTNLSAAGAQAEVGRIKAQSYNDQRYASRYKAVFDVIVGERWVDIAGYNVIGGKMGPATVDCWDAVAQEPQEIQYDHFMRRYDDRNGQGGVTAANTSQQRFIAYFVAAAMAQPEIISVYDGGAAGSAVVDVDHNYFLFGRAAHLFEDSFSSEHTVRIPADNYTSVRQVKSYLCAAGSEQHTHSTDAILKYTSGDVVWIPGTGIDTTWNAYKASFMKTGALVATEATKDLWAAFIRTMGTPMAQRETVARAEADTLVKNWLSYDENEMKAWYDDEAHRDDTYVLAQADTGKGQTVQACMTGLKVGTDDQQKYVDQQKATQRMCLYNAISWPGYQDLFDTSLHIWFSWQWRNKVKYVDPPSNWQIASDQTFPADSGVPVRIKSVANQQYMTSPGGIGSNEWVYVKPGTPPLDFIVVGPKANGVFRLAKAPLLFLSYRDSDGAVKLYAPGSTYDPTDYKISPAGPGWSLMNIYYQKYMYLDAGKQSPYIDRHGNPANANAQWIIEGLK